MKAGDVLKMTGISRRHLSSFVKQGKIKVMVKPSGQYDYNPDDVYQYVGKVRRNLNIIYARVSTPNKKRI
jgi:predicted site-specific integrase-resolvase